MKKLSSKAKKGIIALSAVVLTAALVQVQAGDAAST